MLSIELTQSSHEVSPRFDLLSIPDVIPSCSIIQVGKLTIPHLVNMHTYIYIYVRMYACMSVSV